MNPRLQNIRRLSSLGLLAVALFGCSDPTTPSLSNLDLDVSGGSFQAGAVIAGKLTNRSTEGITYNFCFAVVDQRQGSSWIQVQDPRVCAAVALSLPAGESTSYEYRLPTSLTVGTYRLRLEVNADYSPWRGEITSSSFEVEP